MEVGYYDRPLAFALTSAPTLTRTLNLTPTLHTPHQAR